MARPSSKPNPEPEARRESLIRYPQLPVEDGGLNQEGRGEPPEFECLTYEEFLSLCSLDPKGLFMQINQQLKEAIDVTDNYETQIRDKDSQIDALAEEKERFQRALALMVANQVNDRSTPVPMTGDKSTKLPDPPLLTDGKDPKFEDWLSKMRSKLSANEDHYPTEKLRKAYVENRVGGKAADHLAPRLKDEAINKYTTAEEMFKHLECIFLDPNRVINAKRNFKSLMMKTGEPFQDFLTNFLYISGEAKAPVDSLKEEIYLKLTPKLQELTLNQWVTEITFDEYVNYCSKIADNLRVIEKRVQHQSERRFTSNKETFRSPFTNTFTPVTMNYPMNTQPRKELTPIDSTERERLMREGRCYYCKERGHLARDCARRQRATELKILDKGKGQEMEAVDCQSVKDLP